MPTSTVTSKGQITIPAQVRAALGLEAGTRVEFVKVEKGQYLLVPATDDVQSLKGMLRKPCSPVSIEDMNRAIAERWDAIQSSDPCPRAPKSACK